MGLFTRKRDPISERARTLESEIQKLENEIQKLHEQASEPPPKFRSSTLPGGAQAAKPPAPHEEFEYIDQTQLQARNPPLPTEHYNELGLRKYDLTATWRRFKAHLKGPATPNPKLVNYLAAGSIQGLRPLRYEKRVARNRFILFVTILVLLLWGILAVVFRR